MGKVVFASILSPRIHHVVCVARSDRAVPFLFSADADVNVATNLGTAGAVRDLGAASMVSGLDTQSDTMDPAMPVRN